MSKNHEKRWFFDILTVQFYDISIFFSSYNVWKHMRYPSLISRNQGYEKNRNVVKLYR